MEPEDHYLQLHQWNLPGPNSGKTFFKGENITYLRPDQVAKRGLPGRFKTSNFLFT